ncbi:MAG: chorismate mutase [Chloroflexi bacterium]|nr:chorismate mutase [Chloroflexota bacterium]
MTLMCRGIRGATTTTENTKEAIISATRELLDKLVQSNQLDPFDVAAALFTTTADLDAEFPALAARQMGWTSVALMCGHEMRVPDAVPKCIRVLMLVNTEKRPEELQHVYLRGAVYLRQRGIN